MCLGEGLVRNTMPFHSTMVMHDCSSEWHMTTWLENVLIALPAH